MLDSDSELLLVQVTYAHRNGTENDSVLSIHYAKESGNFGRNGQW